MLCEVLRISIIRPLVGQNVVRGVLSTLCDFLSCLEPVPVVGLVYCEQFDDADLLIWLIYHVQRGMSSPDMQSVYLLAVDGNFLSVTRASTRLWIRLRLELFEVFSYDPLALFVERLVVVLSLLRQQNIIAHRAESAPLRRPRAPIGLDRRADSGFFLG